MSRQNFLSHGKTYFLTVKLSFSRQNFLSHGKTFYNHISQLHELKKRLINMGAEYFFKGFKYRERCLFLERNHECIISIAILKRKVKQLGLRRRLPCYDIDDVRRTIPQMLDGPNSNLGYSSVWHHLQMKDTRVPRKIVATSLKELDPQGVQERKAHRLRRRVY